MKNKNPDLQSMLQHLAEENIQPEQIDLWPGIQADLVIASKSTDQHKEFEMKKRFVFTALAAVLVFAAVAVFAAKNVTGVSAKEILDRASAEGTVPTEGILHLKTESYFNVEAIEGKGTQTILDSYSDLQSNYFRNVTVNTQTGNVMDAFAYDGANTYSRDYNQQDATPLTVYRTPQGKLAQLKPMGADGDKLKSSEMFAKMREDPNVKFLGEQSWDDGRKVYVLQSQQQMKVMVKKGLERPMGLVTIYFDTETYKQLGYRMTMQKDGKEILLGSQKVLVDEILPANTPVAWDLSDVQGITIVDDPGRTHGDLLPEVISAEQLAAKTKNAYLLKAIPEGYLLEISEPQIKPGSTEPYMYIATYRKADDYFVIQSGAGFEVKAAIQGTDETYAAANGLVLHFMEEPKNRSEKSFTSALVEAPNDVTFMITSTLPREAVKQWAEGLSIVK
jgi:hypothetical protein